MRGKAGSFVGRPGVTLLLMKFNGVNASSTFTDSSIYGRTITTVGDAIHSNVQSKFDGMSVLSDGTGQYLKVSNQAFNFESINFTIEFWLYRSGAITGSAGVFANGRRTGVQEGMTCFVQANGLLRVEAYFSSWVSPVFEGNVSADAWHHCAITRDGSVYRLWINGEQAGSYETASDIQWPALADASLFSVAGDAADLSDHDSTLYLDELRISRQAVYTAAFTPPTAPF